MQDYNFPVALEDVFTKGGVRVPRTKSVVRTDTGVPLSVVSDRYRIFTHNEAVEALQPFLNSFGEAKTVSYLEKDGTRFVHQHTFQNRSLSVKSPKLNDTVAYRMSIINTYDGMSSLMVKIGAMVLRCLNGMTVPGGTLELGFRHTEAIRNIELPDAGVLLDLFQTAGKDWNQWGQAEVTSSHRDQILDLSLRMQVISPTALNKFRDRLDPNGMKLEAGHTFWDYYNEFTYVLTHELKRVQETKRFGRLDRLNTIFHNVLNDVKEVPREEAH